MKYMGCNLIGKVWSQTLTNDVESNRKKLIFSLHLVVSQSVKSSSEFLHMSETNLAIITEDITELYPN